MNQNPVARRRISTAREIVAAAIAALAFLTALYRSNPDWMYTGFGWLDTWLTASFGVYLDNPNFLNDYYKVSRLPWNLYQYIVRHIFLPVPAEIVIQFSMYAASAVLMYYVGSRLFGRVAGISIGIFTAAATIVHANGGTDYPTQMAGPLFFAVIAAIVWASNPAAKPARYVAVGACLSCLLHTFEAYVFTLPFIVGVGLALPALRGQIGARGLAIRLGFTVLGACAMTALLCAINAAFGRGWLFFIPALRYALELSAHHVPTPWVPWSLSWVIDATQLGFIFGVAALACAEILRLLVSRTAARHRVAFCLHTLYLVEVLIWVVLQTRGDSALTPSYVAYPLYGPMFVSLVASLAPRLVDTPITVPLSFVFVPILFFVGLQQDASDPLWYVRHLLDHGCLLAMAGLLALYILIWILPRHTLVTIVALCGLPVINALTSLSPGDYAASTCHIKLDLYNVMVDNSMFLDGLTNNPQNVFVWGDSSETLTLPKDCSQGGTTDGIAYPFAEFGHSFLVSEAWPAMPQANALPLGELHDFAARDAVIVLVTNDPKRASSVVARFAQAGAPIYFVATLVPPRGNPLPAFYVYRTRRCVDEVCLSAGS